MKLDDNDVALLDIRMGLVSGLSLLSEIKKADAIMQILARYAPTALPIYIGDDRTNQAAFEAIAEIGMAIHVEESPRKTAAARFLKNPTEVYLFLRCLTHMREKGKSEIKLDRNSPAPLRCAPTSDAGITTGPFGHSWLSASNRSAQRISSSSLPPVKISQPIPQWSRARY
ncbi:MAG: hypothetical protein ACXW6K_01015 [Candidatus Binatia bacterium]